MTFARKKRSTLGFSLIELMITLAMLALLLALGMPGMSEWIKNTKIRTTAEAIQNGLQLARGEAVRRNALIRFQLTDTVLNGCSLSTTGTNWIVSYDNPEGICGAAKLNEAFAVSDTGNNPAPRIIQVRPAEEGSANVQTVATSHTIIFSGLGRADADSTIDVVPGQGTCKKDGGTSRCLRVVVTNGGQIRMCDPALPSGDTQKC